MKAQEKKTFSKQKYDSAMKIYLLTIYHAIESMTPS